MSIEGSGLLGRIILGVRTNRSTTDILHRHVLDVETNVVSRHGLRKGLMVHFDGLHLSGDILWGEGNNHTGLENTGLDTSDRDSSDTSNTCMYNLALPYIHYIRTQKYSAK